jgi:AcrR family transcriptional regulator
VEEIPIDTVGADRPSGPVLTQRARKRNERRDRVFDAAITLFVEKGFEETSMDDIAERSGLARTTVFNHFPRKVHFLEEWTLRRRLRAAHSFGLTGLGGRPVEEVLRDYMSSLAEVNLETRAETRALQPATLTYTSLLFNHPLAKDLAELVAETMPTLRATASPDQIGQLLALGYFSAVMHWVEHEPSQFDLANELIALVSTVLDGALER